MPDPVVPSPEKEVVWIADCSECDWAEPFDSEAEADAAASFHTDEHLSAEAGLPFPDVCPLCGGKPHPARKDSDFYGGTLR